LKHGLYTYSQVFDQQHHPFTYKSSLRAGEETKKI